jgi:hypothetical protein
MMSLGVAEMIDQNDLEMMERHFDSRYKLKDDCDRDMKAVDERHHILDKQFSVINTKLSALLWGVGVLGSAVIGVLVKMIFGA